MPMPFNSEEIDDLDEFLLETMDQEELAEFREKLQETMDEMESFPPDPAWQDDEYYEWQDRINVLNDLIDAIDLQIKKSLHQQIWCFPDFSRVLKRRWRK